MNQRSGNHDKKEPHHAQFCHVAYYTGNHGQDTLYGITDCACSRTVAGRDWIKNMIKAADNRQISYFLMKQDEIFKFGGPDTFPSKRALVVWLEINGKPFALKISEVNCTLPLLLSRGVLAGLGMRYDLEGHLGRLHEVGGRGAEAGHDGDRAPHGGSDGQANRTAELAIVFRLVCSGAAPGAVRTQLLYGAQGHTTSDGV